VTQTDAKDLEPIRRRDDLLLPFVEACKPRSEWRIGPEAEKAGVFADGSPVPYSGERSVLRVLEHLVTAHGWVAEREHEGAPVIALARAGASVTLEPGGQLELSGAMATNVHEVYAEAGTHLAEIAPLSRQLGITWLGVGFHPFARREDFEWVPKQRYGVMRQYLPTRGARALDMMLRTCTVQANYDYSAEADAMRKMRVSLALSPATTAMFANSPFTEGKPNGGVTQRGRTWLEVDPDRSGLLPALWEPGAGFERYVEWALDVPMFVFKREGHAIENTGQTFRSFMADGFAGHRPNLDDWKLHINTIFTDVRLKKTIEIRGADMQGGPLAGALAAVWTGIFYDDRALSEAEALVQGWTHDELAELRTRVWRDGLRSSFRGKPLTEVAARIVTIAKGGLERRAVVDPASGRDESVHLDRLSELVARGQCPADVLLEGLDREKDLKAAMLARSTLVWPARPGTK
jgi:glutamate--cysteine ligase